MATIYNTGGAMRPFDVNRRWETPELNPTTHDVRSYFPDKLRRRVPTMELPHHAILDSGASWGIVGTPWLMRWSTCENQGELHRYISASRRRFRFGCHQSGASLGSLLIKDGVKNKESEYHSFLLEVDIVAADVPLLISRTSLPRMSALVDFRHPSLTLLSKIAIPLNLSPGGHIAVQLFQRYPCLVKSSAVENISMNNVGVAEETEVLESDGNERIMDGRLLTATDIPKLHRAPLVL